MPHYYFHVANGVREVDPDGVELADDRAAQRAAVAYLGGALEDDPELLWRKGNWRVEVTDGDGRHKWTVLAMAVDAPGDDDPSALQTPA